METVRITFAILAVLCAGCDRGPDSTESHAPKAAQYSFSNNPQVALAECSDALQGSDEQKIAAFINHAEAQLGVLRKIDPAVGTASATAGGDLTSGVSAPLETCVGQLRERQLTLGKQKR